MRREYVNLVKNVIVEEQEFSSAKTSRPQVPALHAFVVKKNLIPTNALVLDYGGGKFDLGKEHIESSVEGATLLVFDPFNRTEEHNNSVISILSRNKADVILNANVLNVIKEKSARLEMLNDIKKYAKQGAKIFFSVYKAERSSKYAETDQYVGQQTSDGWQNAQPTSFYLPEVKEVFPSAIIRNNIIVAE